MLDFVRIPVGKGAAPRCALCGPGDTTSYLPAERVREAVLAAVASSTDPTGPNLCLAGPEPFEHPDLPQLVVACAHAGARRIALETDAAALSVARNAEGVIAAGVHHLHVRVLEADPMRGEALGVSPGRTKDSLAGIAAYRHAAHAAAIRTVISILLPVCPHNLGALPEIVVQAAAMPVDRVRLIAAATLPSSAPALLTAACDTGMVNGVWVEADEALGLPVSHRLHVVSGECR